MSHVDHKQGRMEREQVSVTSPRLRKLYMHAAGASIQTYADALSKER